VIRRWGKDSREWVPSVPFAEFLEQRVVYWKRREDMYWKWRGNQPQKRTGALKSTCLELGWWAEENNQRAWEAPLRRLYRYRNQLTDGRMGGTAPRGGGPGSQRCSLPTDVYQRHIVEEALFHADVDLRDLYEAYAERLTGRRGRPRDVLRFIEIWEPLCESWAADDAPLESDVWCEACGEFTTPIDGRCPWHSKAYELRAA
jgi:hypothetical protein